MSSFLHKAEDALHLHHKKHPSQDNHHAQVPEQPQQQHPHDHQQEPHDPRAPAPPAVAHEGTHHDHHGKRDSHHPSPAEIARADFMADRQYDRILKSPDHGAGIGFEM
ncbi:hypothetical protein BO86DRAFT_393720 [Aspergillus japonicus CBS 114.51]|uniref:Uncharacterized protein n=2 Tax=Aspergillus TaxID=5052 RepID=A0A2V5I1C3_ASPV1|nr:hypothetical protein BO86DRAFT_393720 [Aspergillus japonicus CBS 114.51]PYI13456.1 hypothetical protein BO99DRAFT_56658 [Aspergillus violaceofuscus CBS 115571]RAH76089.1 hypothetical protein BO86DRAFT_393720 [Aspergillus japonicus CBS 114.51]